MKQQDVEADLEGALERGDVELVANHLLPASERQQGLEALQNRWLFFFLAASMIASLGGDSSVRGSVKQGQTE